MASSNKDLAFTAADTGFSAAVVRAVGLLQDNLIADPSATGREGAQDRFKVALQAAIDARTIARTVVDSVLTD